MHACGNRFEYALQAAVDVCMRAKGLKGEREVGVQGLKGGGGNKKRHASAVHVLPNTCALYI